MWRDVIWVGVLALVSAALVSTSIWENGDIELKWWAVKAWADGALPDFAPNHHNMRWAITFPAVAWVRLFGDGALSYLLLNHVVFALTTAGLYALIRSVTTPLIAALMLALWLVNPVVYSLPSNLMPELWSIFYVVGALLLLQRAYATGSHWFYAGAIVVLFCAYGAKETNIFFMPGLGLYEIFRRRWVNVGLICGVFGVLWVVETVAVNLILSDMDLWFGRAQAIVQAGHLDEMSNIWLYQPIDLILRWGFVAETNFDRLEFFSKAIYLCFFAVSAVKAWSWIKARTLLPPAGAIGPGDAPAGAVISAGWAMGLAFAFCTTFFILGLDPLVLGQPLNDRYLWVLLAPAYLVLAVVLQYWLARAAAADKGPLACAGRLQRWAEPFTTGHMALASLLVIAGVCTLARWPIEVAAIEIRRRGFDQPYTVFTAQSYFDEARAHLSAGCTLVFPRLRPAQTVLIHAYHHRELLPTTQVLELYRGGLDGLQVEGRTLRVWAVPRHDWPQLEGLLYADMEIPDFQPYAIRLVEAGSCERAYWLGQADIHPRDQLLSGPLGEPPPR